MDDLLKQRVEKERDAFEIYDAPEGLWEEIDNKLSRNEQPASFPKSWLRLAASVALVAVASAIWIMMANQSEKGMMKSLYRSSPELAETEFFYRTQIQEKMNMLTTRMPDNQGYLKDFSKLDSAYAELRQDLKDQADNQEVVKAMIENYKLKLIMLERILNAIEENENESANNNISL